MVYKSGKRTSCTDQVITSWLRANVNLTDLSKIDPDTLGQRIRAHRLALGMSLRELSRHVPVSAQALNQYERSITRPRSDVLEVLTDVLGIRPEQLHGDLNDMRLELVQVRQLRECARKTVLKAQGHLVAMTERSLILEQKLGGGFPAPSLPVMEEIRPVRNQEDVERLALDVRMRWGLGTGPLPRIVSLFEARGIRVFELENNEGFQNFKSWSMILMYAGTSSRSELPVAMLNSTLSGEDKRFVLCHELAIMILPNSLRYLLKENVRTRYANRFAGALLLPTSELRNQLGRKRRALSWYELREIKNQFGINYDWIVRRCLETGIISRDTYRNLLNQYSADKTNKLSQGSLKSSDESSTRLKTLAIRAVTEGVMPSREAASLLNMSQKEFKGLT